MTYKQARSRAYWYSVLSWALLGFAMFMVLIAITKAVYYSVQQPLCPNWPAFCYKARNVIKVIYGFDTVNPVRWFWPLFLDVPFELWFESLFGPAGATVIFLFGYSLYLRNKGSQIRADVIAVRRDAQRKKISETYEGRGSTTNINTQSTGPIHAGGNVNIHQEMNNAPRIKTSDKDFSKTPLGLIMISIVCDVIAIVLGPIILVAVGLAHLAKTQPSPIEAGLERRSIQPELRPSPAVDHANNQKPFAGFAIEDHMPRVFVAAQARPDMIGGAAHAGIVGQQIEGRHEPLQVGVGLRPPEPFGRVEINIAQMLVSLSGEPAFSHSG